MVLPYEPQNCKRSKKPFVSAGTASRPRRALFQVYISYSVQKGQASSCKMYTRGEISVEIGRFLVKMQAFCRILTRPGTSAIFFTDFRHEAGCAGRSPFSPSRWSIYPKRVSAPFVRSAAARRKPRQVFRHCSFIIYRRHEGVCFWCEHQRQTLFSWLPLWGSWRVSA